MSDLRIKTCVLGPVSTNCYLIYHQETKEALIIDPADNASYLLNKCRELGVVPVGILLTHGHFDHILAAEDIRRAFHIKIYAGEKEVDLLQSPTLNLSWTHAGKETTLVADSLVKDEMILNLIGFRWKVITTPGHTAGSVCYQIESEKILLSGDTLFEESLGRTDLPTADPSAIVHSITQKLFLLAEDTVVYPGHGDPTTIGHEKKHNPAAVYRS